MRILKKGKALFGFGFLVLLAFVIFGLLGLIFSFAPSTNRYADEANKLFSSRDYKGFGEFAKKIGPDSAYKLLKARFPENQGMAHDFAHVIGLAAYAKQGAAGLTVCDFAYAYGCFHGFIEGFLAAAGTGVISQIEQSCTAMGSVHAPSCLHGIGHGLLAYDGYNLTRALSDCDFLQQGSKTYCFDGVFMERATGSMQTASQRFKLTADNLLAPCDVIGENYKRECWRNQVFNWRVFFGGDMARVGKQCSLIEKNFQDTCFENFGISMVLAANSDAGQIAALCKTLPDGPASDKCLGGAMSELMFEGKPPNLAQSLCKSFSQQAVSGCSQRFGQLLGEYNLRFAGR